MHHALVILRADRSPASDTGSLGYTTSAEGLPASLLQDSVRRLAVGASSHLFGIQEVCLFLVQEEAKRRANTGLVDRSPCLVVG